jgi:trimethylamine:corrinoid methyltransferase-like protein
MITTEDKRRCLKREIAMRRAAYPDWVARGKMTRAQADREIAVMEAILKDYEEPDLLAAVA